MCAPGNALILISDACFSGQWVLRAKRSTKAGDRVWLQTSVNAAEGSEDINSFSRGWIAAKFQQFDYKPSSKKLHPMFYSSETTRSKQTSLPLGKITAHLWSA